MKHTIRYAWGGSTLGDFIAATTDRGLVAVEFGQPDGDLAATLQQRFSEFEVIEDSAGLRGMVAAIGATIEHPETPSELAVDLRGSDFELRVWRELQKIPAGQTLHYGEVALRLGVPGQAREVAEACAANTIAVLIPCHRVVKKDGSISGYRWGYRRKRTLLEREQRAGFHLA